MHFLRKIQQQAGAAGTSARVGQRRRIQRRCGAAAVEFAFVAPVLLLFIFAIIEFGRGMMLKEVSAGAARAGVRQAVVTSATFTSTKNTTQDRLDRAGVKNATIKVFTIDSTGKATEVTNDTDFKTNATANARIRVEVSVPYKDNSWLPGQFFIKNATLTDKADMRKEG